VRERGKLARQLHDEVASAMFAAKLSLDVVSGMAARGATGDKLRPALDDATRFANAAMSALRAACAELGEPGTQNIDIFGNLTDLLRGFEQETGIKCDLSIQSDCAEIERESAASILKAARQKLSEIAGRTDVSRVQVDLQAQKRRYDLKVHAHGIGGLSPLTSVGDDFPPVRGGNDTRNRPDGPTDPLGAKRSSRNTTKAARGSKAETGRTPAGQSGPAAKMSRQPAEDDRALGSE
jgi:signal transduction histidine kinase